MAKKKVSKAKSKRKVSKGRSWRAERESGNKYSGSDSGKKPAPGTRKTYWRSGYTRKDGTKVKGGYVKNPNYKGKK
jgi:hypothetical protein